LGKDSEAVFIAFGIADDELILGEVQVFNAQAKPFFDSESCAVEKLCYQLMGTL
jgi:hypothetical protein